MCYDHYEFPDIHKRAVDVLEKGCDDQTILNTAYEKE